jgi:hypothetical protein
MITLVECFKYLQSNCNARLDETNKCARRARPWEENEKKIAADRSKRVQPERKKDFLVRPSVAGVYNERAASRQLLLKRAVAQTYSTPLSEVCSDRAPSNKEP